MNHMLTRTDATGPASLVLACLHFPSRPFQLGMTPGYRSEGVLTPNFKKPVSIPFGTCSQEQVPKNAQACRISLNLSHTRSSTLNPCSLGGGARCVDHLESFAEGVCRNTNKFTVKASRRQTVQTLKQSWLLPHAKRLGHSKSER